MAARRARLDLARARRSATPARRTIALGLAVATAVGGWILAPLVGPELVPGNDVTGHLVRTEVGLDIVRDLRLDGWNPRFGVGYEQFLFYGPGFTWLAGAVEAFGLGLVSDAGVVKLLAVLSYLGIPAGTALLARALGLGARATGLAAVTSLLASGPTGIGPQALFGLGLLPQQLGAVLVLVLLAAIVHVLRTGSRRWAVVAGATTFALLVSHLISVAFAAAAVVLLVPAVLAVHTGDVGPALRRLVAAAAAGTGLASFWLVPTLAHRNLHGPIASWETPPLGRLVGEIAQGQILFLPIDVMAVAVGLAWGFVRWGRGRPSAGIVAAGPIVLLVLLLWSKTAFPNELTFQLGIRYLGLIGILLTLPLAALLAETSRRLPLPPTAAYLAVLAVAAAFVVRDFDHRTLVEQPPQPTGAVVAAAGELRRAVPDGARFASVRWPPAELAATGVAQPDRWLAWASGRSTLNVYPLELSSASGATTVADHLHELDPEVAADALHRGGVTHIVTFTSEDTERYADSLRYELVWERAPMAILALRPVRGQPPPAAQVTTDVPADAELLVAERERLVVAIDASAPAAVTVAVAWSPKWRATVGGDPVPTRRTAEGLLQLDVPAGSSTVELRFGRDRWNALGIAGTLGTALVLALGWRREREARSGGRMPPHDGRRLPWGRRGGRQHAGGTERGATKAPERPSNTERRRHEGAGATQQHRATRHHRPIASTMRSTWSL